MKVIQSVSDETVRSKGFVYVRSVGGLSVESGCYASTTDLQTSRHDSAKLRPTTKNQHYKLCGVKADDRNGAATNTIA